MEKFLHILEKFKEETAVPSIELTIKRKNHIAITDSKIGGNPYLPKDFVYPTSPKGEPLKLLAQLNFAGLPALEHFPSNGILQFFVLPDDIAGVHDYENLTKQDTFRVIYHKEIVSAENRMTEFPAMESVDEMFPVKDEFYIKGKLASCPMTESTFEFCGAFRLFCQKYHMEDYADICFTDILEAKNSMTKSDFREFDRKRDELRDLVSGAPKTRTCKWKARTVGFCCNTAKTSAQMKRLGISVIARSMLILTRKLR